MKGNNIKDPKRATAYETPYDYYWTHQGNKTWDNYMEQVKHPSDSLDGMKKWKEDKEKFNKWYWDKGRLTDEELEIEAIHGKGWDNPDDTLNEKYYRLLKQGKRVMEIKVRVESLYDKKHFYRLRDIINNYLEDNAVDSGMGTYNEKGEYEVFAKDDKGKYRWLKEWEVEGMSKEEFYKTYGNK